MVVHHEKKMYDVQFSSQKTVLAIACKVIKKTLGQLLNGSLS